MFAIPDIKNISHHALPLAPMQDGWELKEIPSLSYANFSAANHPDNNRIIQADNLKAMQSLLPEFENRIQCIYIDPPYNTGNIFAHYADDAEHSQWLAAIGTRLALMRMLLKESGIIFVSIGDEEAAYLKVMMDGIFGRNNYCGTIVWEKKKKPSFLNRHMGTVTEFILAYAKNRTLTGPFIYGQTTPNKRYPINNKGNGIRSLRFPAGKVHFGCRDGYYPPQDMSSPKIICRLLDGVTIRQGKNLEDFHLEGEWRYSQETLDTLIAAGEIIQISKVPFRPNHIKPGGAPKKLKNLLAHYQMSTYEDATEESRALFGAAAFDYPKPERLIHLLLNAVTQPGDWVLDAFAGSGTTGAVAHKMGRAWIMIEQGEHCQTHIVPRMRKVIDGTDPGGISRLVEWQGGGTFHYFEESRLIARPQSAL
jgi:adenine-specific DNA-methyltransferase